MADLHESIMRWPKRYDTPVCQILNNLTLTYNIIAINKYCDYIGW